MTPGDSWWPLANDVNENDVNEKKEGFEKQGKIPQKQGLMAFPKNWIGILRPAINELMIIAMIQ